MSKFSTIGLACLLVVLGITACGSSPGSAGSGSTSNLKATDVGITSSEIRIGVIADVNDVAIPGFGTTTVDGVKAFAAYMNAHGGLGGRKIVVDFYDGKLDPATTTSDLTQACAKDFALVGSFSLAMSNVSPLVSCANSAGKAIGMPDLAQITVTPQETSSKVSYAVSPDSYLKAPNGDFLAQVGAVRYFATHILKDKVSSIHGTWIIPSNNPSSKAFQLATIDALQTIGVKTDNTFQFTGAETEAAYGPVLTSASSAKSQFIVDTLPDTSFIALRQAASQTSVKTIWYCPGATCYSPQFLKAGSAVDGTYTDTFFVPTQEKSVTGVAEYLKYVGSNPVDGFGEAAFAAGLVFRDAIEQVVKADGNNGLTRAHLLSTLAHMGTETADGILAPTDIGARAPTKCFMLLQDDNGQWVQAYPTAAGTFDCSASNMVTLTHPPAGA